MGLFREREERGKREGREREERGKREKSETSETSEEGTAHTKHRRCQNRKTKHCRYLHMEVQKDNHFTARRLKECLLDVTVDQVDFISLESGVPQTVCMGLQCALRGRCGRWENR